MVRPLILLFSPHFVSSQCRGFAGRGVFHTIRHQDRTSLSDLLTNRDPALPCLRWCEDTKQPIAVVIELRDFSFSDVDKLVADTQSAATQWQTANPALPLQSLWANLSPNWKGSILVFTSDPCVFEVCICLPVAICVPNAGIAHESDLFRFVSVPQQAIGQTNPNQTVEFNSLFFLSPPGISVAQFVASAFTVAHVWWFDCVV